MKWAIFVYKTSSPYIRTPIVVGAYGEPTTASFYDDERIFKLDSPEDAADILATFIAERKEMLKRHKIQLNLSFYSRYEIVEEYTIGSPQEDPSVKPISHTWEVLPA